MRRRENGTQVSIITEHATWKGEPTVLSSPEGGKTFHNAVVDLLGSLKVTEN